MSIRIPISKRLTSRAVWRLALSLVVVIAVGHLPGVAAQAAEPGLRVLAVETFLADIAQQVAADRLTITALMPVGADPHSFEPAPGDMSRVADSQVLIINGAGFEAFLEELLANVDGERTVIEASAGLVSRAAREGEAAMMSDEGDGQHQHEADPHFWLDPNLVIRYVENIRDGLSQVDPEGASVYAANAAAYIEQLKALDAWIVEQVQQVPPERRLLVTNHESFGYFADRYGFKIVGAVLPSVSTGASPSAQQLARLVDHIRASGAPAIFLETGSDTRLAEQVAAETGARVVSDLYTHSLTEPDGPAPSYLAMMRHNVTQIVNALK